MVDKEKIKHLAKNYLSNSRKCIAFGRYCNNTSRFSFNGFKNFSKYGDDALIQAITKILGNNAEYINDNYAFTVLNPTMPIPYVKYLELSLYSMLNCYKTCTIILSFLLPNQLDYDDAKKYNHEYFTCAEKKLYSDKLPVKPTKVYVTRRPCYHCIPVINNVYYYHSHNIYHLTKQVFCHEGKNVIFKYNLRKI